MSAGLAKLSPQELASYPLIPPPNGIVSNFGDAQNANRPFFIVDSLLCGIMAIFYLNRVYTKMFIVRRFSCDDLTISFAFIGSIFYYAACIWGMQRGRMGHHNWDISIVQASSMNLLIPIYIITVLSSPVMLSLKLTFFIMYLDIFRPMRWMRISGYIGAVFVCAFYGSMTVAMFIFATPRRGETWFSHTQTSAEQRDDKLSSVPQSVVGLAIDLAILVLPVIAVMQLQLPTKRKVAVILVFATGLLACLCSLLSIYYRYKQYISSDLLWVLTPVNIVTVLEFFVGVICACTPSAAKSCHHHLQYYDTLKTYIQSRLYSAQSLSKSPKYSPASGLQNSRTYTEDKNHPSQYSNINIYQGPVHPDCVQSKSIRTFVQRGKQSVIESDGIYLTYKMQHAFSVA